MKKGISDDVDRIGNSHVGFRLEVLYSLSNAVSQKWLLILKLDGLDDCCGGSTSKSVDIRSVCRSSWSTTFSDWKGQRAQQKNHTLTL